MTKLIVYAQL